MALIKVYKRYSDTVNLTKIFHGGPGTAFTARVRNTVTVNKQDVLILSIDYIFRAPPGLAVIIKGETVPNKETLEIEEAVILDDHPTIPGLVIVNCTAQNVIIPKRSFLGTFLFAVSKKIVF
jgi:hypothetical protein